VHAGGPVVFSGGVARNGCICDLIRESLDQRILVAEDPQSAGAVGAALIATSGAANGSSFLIVSDAILKTSVASSRLDRFVTLIPAG
jgi:sugar (pentulose or hexulose) kinase